MSELDVSYTLHTATEGQEHEDRRGSHAPRVDEVVTLDHAKAYQVVGVPCGSVPTAGKPSLSPRANSTGTPITATLSTPGTSSGQKPQDDRCR